MKKIKFLIILTTFVMVFTACSENDPGVVPPEDEKPIPTPVGTPIGIPNSKTIGASGGTIISLDGMMGLEIPAGALTTDTEITIQPIANFAPNGNGNAYQLSPEGIKFNKPIKITFRHGHDVSAVMPPLTGITFQDTDGIWYSSGNFTWDEANKTVSSETMHFSGWATFDVLKVEPKGNIKSDADKYGNLVYQLKISESADFELIAIKNIPKLFTGEVENITDELIPLIIQKKDNELGVIVKAWSANEEENGKPTGKYGTITVTGPDSVCTYKAPANKPEGDSNPVQLSVKLRGLKYRDPRNGQVFNDLIVSNQIEITGEFHFNLEIKYNNPLVGPFGGVGDFVNTDLATLKIHVKANGEVIVSDTSNTVGTITPGSFTRFNCTASWIPEEDSDPGITVTGGTGAIISGGAGNSSVDYLFITLKGDAQLAKWKVKCEGKEGETSGGESSYDQPLLGPTFPFKR